MPREKESNSIIMNNFERFWPLQFDFFCKIILQFQAGRDHSSGNNLFIFRARLRLTKKVVELGQCFDYLILTLVYNRLDASLIHRELL